MARGRKPKQQSKGLGDTIENITEATGIKKVVKAIAGDDCGCNERKDYLNKVFSYRKKLINCPTDEMIEKYKKFKQTRTLNILTKTGKAESDEVDMLENIYAHVRGFVKYKICRSCPNSGKEVIAVIEYLDEVFKEYN